MSCETTLVRLLVFPERSCWVDPLMVRAIRPAGVESCSVLSIVGSPEFLVAGTPDEVHRMLFPEEALETALWNHHDFPGEPVWLERAGARKPPLSLGEELAMRRAGWEDVDPDSMTAEELGCPPDVMQGEMAGFCERCDGPVHHRPGKPGEYDHDCPAEAQMAVADSEVNARSNLIDDPPSEFRVGQTEGPLVHPALERAAVPREASTERGRSVAELLESSIALATDVLLLPVDSVRPEIRSSANRVRALARDLITFRESLP